MTCWSKVMMVLAAVVPNAHASEDERVVDPRRVIALETGTWDAVITTPAQADGRPTSTVRGIQVNELRSGGVWMLNRMSVNGGAYEGTGIWGYDQATGRYSGAWVDNGAGVIRRDEGRWDPGARTMTWTSEGQRPDGTPYRLRATSTFIGNRRIYRSYQVTAAGEVPLSTVIFTRRSQ